MKKLSFFFLLFFLIAGCSSNAPIEATGFPLDQGTTWVYAYEAYNPSPSDPTQIIKATYELTQTIVDTKTISSYVIAHVQRDRELINADDGWTQELSSQPNEFWYVRHDGQIFQSNFALDTANIHSDQLILDYEFPLSVRKSWCLMPDSRNKAQEVAGCDFVGRREVTDQGSYETPAGKFENCYDLMDIYNGGNILHKFCDGVGIVFMKFDHSGTGFGFEQTLIRYFQGTP
jgi:hypothetical protein